MKKSKKTGYICLALLFLAGLAILLYPSASDRWNRQRAEKLIASYDEVAASGGIDYSEDLKKAREYNESLIGSPVPDAFSQRDGAVDPEYEAILNVGGDGVIGYVEIPVIDVKIPIYHYTSEESLKKGAGHLFGSSLPIGGESTHSVLSAHRGLPDAKLFTDLNLVKEGDIFSITVLSETMVYEVDRILTVEPDETDSLAIVEGEDQVTLVTCTPYAVNTHRLLVHGHRVDEVQEEQQLHAAAAAAKVRHGSALWIHLLCALLGVILALIIVRLLSMGEGRKKNRRRRGRRS